MSLVEALLLRPIRTAHERQRPARKVRQHGLADAVVVAREVELRDLQAGPDLALGMRDLHPQDEIGAAFFFGGAF